MKETETLGREGVATLFGLFTPTQILARLHFGDRLDWTENFDLSPLATLQSLKEGLPQLPKVGPNKGTLLLNFLKEKGRI